jgi:flagellar basal body P-ring protein FlgI
MRIALIAFTLIGGFMIGSSAIKQVTDIQTTRQNQLCQIDPSFCDTDQ